MAKKQRTMRAIKSNPGIRSLYRRQLEALIKAMAEDVHERVLETYRKKEWRIVEEPMAQDAKWRSPAEIFSSILDPLTEKWTKRFKKAADTIAPSFVKSIWGRVKSAKEQALKSASVDIKLHPSREIWDKYQARIQENIALIRTIPSEYLSKVNTQVQRAIANGTSADDLAKELSNDYGVTFRRARVIAIDQTTKATQAFSRETDMELGITEGIWVHVPGEISSRETHIQMNGKRFKLSEGMYDPDPHVRRFVKPGELILCRCTYRSVLPTTMGKSTED